MLGVIGAFVGSHHQQHRILDSPHRHSRPHQGTVRTGEHGVSQLADVLGCCDIPQLFQLGENFISVYHAVKILSLRDFVVGNQGIFPAGNVQDFTVHIVDLLHHPAGDDFIRRAFAVFTSFFNDHDPVADFQSLA